MSLAPPNETSQKLHSSLIQNMFDSSSLLVLSKGQIDKISVSYQLRILTLVRAISNISDGVQIRINGMKTSINLLSQISVNTYINNQGISIEFLRALLWEVAVIDSLILQRIFTAEVSKSCPNVSLMNILFTALKRCFVRVGGNVDDKSGFETVCDSIVCALGMKPFGTDQLLLTNLFSCCRILTVINSQSLSSLTLIRKVCELACEILSSSATNLDLKITAACFVSGAIDHCSGLDKEQAQNSLLDLYRESVRIQDISNQLVILRAAAKIQNSTALDFSASQFCELTCQSVYDYFYYGLCFEVFHIDDCDIVAEPVGPSCDLLLLCAECVELLRNGVIEPSLQSSMGGKTSSSLQFIQFIVSILQGLKRISTSELDLDVKSAVNVLRLLRILTRDIFSSEVADIVIPSYLDIVSNKSTHFIVRKTCAENLADFVESNIACFDVVIEHVAATFRNFLVDCLVSQNTASIDDLQSIGVFFFRLSITVFDSPQKLISFQRTLVSLVKYSQIYFCTSSVMSSCSAKLVSSSIAVILEALARLHKANKMLTTIDNLSTFDRASIQRDVWELWVSLLWVKFYFLESYSEECVHLENSYNELALSSLPLIFHREGPGIGTLEVEMSSYIIVDRTNILKCGGQRKIRDLCRALSRLDFARVPLRYAVLISVIALLESSRLEKGLDVSKLLSYLTDSTFSSNPLAYRLLQSLIEALLQSWTDKTKLRIESDEETNKCRKSIVETFRTYVYSSISSNAAVQTIASRFLHSITQSFQWLCSRTDVIIFLLDMLQAVATSLSKTNSYSPFYATFLPAHIVPSASALTNLSSVVSSLVSFSFERTPQQVRDIVCEYSMLSRVSTCANHAGISLVQRIILPQKTLYQNPFERGPLQLDQDRLKEVDEITQVIEDNDWMTPTDSVHSSAEGVYLKSYYIGKAVSLLRTNTVSDSLIVLREYIANIRTRLFEKNIKNVDLIECVWVSTAILRELMYSVDYTLDCKYSLLLEQLMTMVLLLEMFPDCDVHSSIVGNIRWLIVCLPHLLDVFTNFLPLEMDIFGQNKIGIFSPSISNIEAPEDIKLLSVQSFNGEDASLGHTPKPCELFMLLGEDVIGIHSGNINVIAGNISSALFSLKALSGGRIDRRSILPWFKLLGLSLKVIARCFTSPSCKISAERRRAIRERTYRVALAWFETPVTWAESGPKPDPRLALDTFDALSDFLFYLEQDYNVWPLDYPLEGQEGNGIFAFSRFTISRRLKKTTFPLLPVQLYSIRHLYDLVKILVLSELDRVVSWHYFLQKSDSRSQSLIALLDESKVTSILTKLSSILKTVVSKPYICVSWALSPLLSLRFNDRVPGFPLVNSTLCELVGRHSIVVQQLWHGAALLVQFHRLTGDNVAAANAVEELLYFSSAPAHIAIDMLNRCDADGREKIRSTQKMFRSSHSAPSVVRYVVRSLEMLPIDTLQFFLPQLVQLLRRDVFGLLANFIETIAEKSVLICHNLVWLLQTESMEEIQAKMQSDGAVPYPRHGFCRQVIGNDPLPFKVIELLSGLRSLLSDDALSYLNVECSFFDDITNISAKLKAVKDKDKHNLVIKDELVKLGLPTGLYLPTRPDRLVVQVDIDSGIPMQSAAKCPFILYFSTKTWVGPDGELDASISSNDLSLQLSTLSADNHVVVGKKTVSSIRTPIIRNPPNRMTTTTMLGRYAHTDRDICSNSSIEDACKSQENVFRDACIFKVYDDCRQDALVMQVLQIFRSVFEALNLQLTLIPYCVIPNRTGDDRAIGGILEVVADVRSRDQLGKAGSKTLLQYFTSIFGQPGSPGFEQAQYAFSSSLAGYAILCYLLWIKDRHNGNILLDKKGNICHIDFGFILGISPGSNLGFETAAFKLTEEMLELMGGIQSRAFSHFTETAVRGYLVARRLRVPILCTVSAFADSSLPCFMHRDDCLVSLNNRFLPGETDSAAALHRRDLIIDAANKWTTKVYDGVQKMQNNIYF